MRVDDSEFLARLRALHERVQRGDGLKVDYFDGGTVHISTVDVDADGDGRARDFGGSVIEGEFVADMPSEQQRELCEYLSLLLMLAGDLLKPRTAPGAGRPLPPCFRLNDETRRILAKCRRYGEEKAEPVGNANVETMLRLVGLGWIDGNGTTSAGERILEER